MVSTCSAFFSLLLDFLEVNRVKLIGMEPSCTRCSGQSCICRAIELRGNICTKPNDAVERKLNEEVAARGTSNEGCSNLSPLQHEEELSLPPSVVNILLVNEFHLFFQSQSEGESRVV